MLSYWENKHFVRYDDIVIGAGITGLSVAIELAEKFPKKKIAVLERGIFPAGASTRNAGFACMGSLSELVDDINNNGMEEAIALFKNRLEGLQILRARLGDDNIGYQQDGGYELLKPEELHLLDKIDEINKALHHVVHKDAFYYEAATLDQLQFNKKNIAAVITNTSEGSIDTGLMMKNLYQMALRKGVHIFTGTNVDNYEVEGKSITLNCTSVDGEASFVCDTLFICTNAFTPHLIKDAKVTPGRGQVLITEPIPGLHLKGTYHMDAGYYYFREIDGRILFGGGRNLDFETETTTQFGNNKIIRNDLESKLKEWILPSYPDVQIEQFWSGIMGFGKTKKPVCEKISDNIFAAYAFGGMGVALGSKIAKELVELLEK